MTRTDSAPPTGLAAPGRSGEIILPLPRGLRICVPDDPGQITPYVLMEQGDWFEQEIAFVRRLLQPGMRVVDIGANYGAYALTMAAAVGEAGRVWAFEPASATCAFLRESVALNHLGNLVPVQAALSERPGRARLFLHGSSELNSLATGESQAEGFEEVAVQTLDQAAQELGWGAVDFLKLDAEGEECRILAGGAGFFREQSPLVMFELVHGSSINLPLLEQFRGMEYGLYRLVPGLNLLVPFNPDEPRDAFQLNLFSCKEDRAALLEQRGLLARGHGAAAGLGSAGWRQAIGAMEFARPFMAGWEDIARGEAPAGGDGYLAGLDAFVLARDPRHPPSVRYGNLLRAVELLQEACGRSSSGARRSTHARALFALGRRANGLHVIDGLIGELDAGMVPDISEPFLPPSERFEAVPVGGRPGPWFLASLLEQQELLGHWSSYYTARQSAARLRRIRELGYATADLERREGMAARRLAAMGKGGGAAKPDVSRLMQEAIRLLQSGEPGRSEQICRQILAAAPDFAEGLHLGGVVALQIGDAPLAVERLGRAAGVASNDGLVLADLANALMAVGRLGEAEETLRRCLDLQPGLPQVHFNLGNLLARQGRLEEAASAYFRAVELEPRFLEARANLGNALMSLGRPGEAAQAFREALALVPGHAMLLMNLGNALKDQGRFSDAEACHRQALAAEPRLALAHLNLGFTLEAQRKLDAAASSFRTALTLAPDLAEAHCALGNLLLDRGAFDAAIAAYRSAVEAQPAHADAHYNLGNAFWRKGELEEAARAFRRALEINPDSADAWNNLGDVLSAADRHGEAIDALERALKLAPGRTEVLSNLALALHVAGRNAESVALLRQAVSERPDARLHSVLLMQLGYDADLPPERLYEEHIEWARRHAPESEAAGTPLPGSADPERRLRVGYLSPDFWQHSVAHFIAPVMERHDRDRFEVFCYGNSEVEDAMTRRLRGLADHWLPVCGMNNDELAARIRADGIDILVDLAGHTQGNRLTAMGLKPAPVQVTWIGYNNTTGMRQVDYRLTDALADPEGETDRLNAEVLYRLPGCFCCFEPPAEAPEVGPLPSRERGFVAFGCFNNPAKLNSRVLELWAEILVAAPGSRLLLKGKGLAGPERRQAILETFAQRGVAGGRVEFAAPIGSQRDHLAAYHRVDIALDPFPYNGVTTTCEALWMGVPVVALAGRAHAGRTGLTLLTHAGFPQWVAGTEADYVAIAAGLASDIPRLAQIRAALREQLRSSPLMDAAGHTRAVEAAYREMWRRWCEGAR